MAEKDVSRRGYVKYAGAGIVVVAVAGAGAYYATRPTTTPTLPPTTQAPTETKPTTEVKTEGKEFEGVTLNLICDEWWLSETVLPFLGQEFQKRTGGRINITSVPYDELHDKIFIELASQSGSYDIIMPDGAWSGEVMGGGFVDPLHDLINDAEPEFDYADVRGKEFGEWEGTVYGLPSNLHTNAIFCYHKDLFEDAGATVPETWEEFTELAKMFTGYTTSKGETIPYGLSDSGLRDDPIIMQWMVRWDNSGGYRELDPCKGQPGLWSLPDWEPYFNSDKGIACTEMWRTQLQDYGPPGVASHGWDEQVKLFEERQVAMTTSWTCVNYPWEMEDSPIKGTIGYTTPPVQPGEKRCGLNATREYFIPKDAKNKEAAWEFIKMATSKDMDVAAQGLLWGSPMRASTYANKENQEKWPWVKAMEDWKYFDVIVGEPLIPEWYETKEHLGRALSEILTNVKDVKPALDEAAEGIIGIFERAGYR